MSLPTGSSHLIRSLSGSASPHASSASTSRWGPPRGAAAAHGDGGGRQFGAADADRRRPSPPGDSQYYNNSTHHRHDTYSPSHHYSPTPPPEHYRHQDAARPYDSQSGRGQGGDWQRSRFRQPYNAAYNNHNNPASSYNPAFSQPSSQRNLHTQSSAQDSYQRNMVSSGSDNWHSRDSTPTFGLRGPPATPRKGKKKTGKFDIPLPDQGYIDMSREPAETPGRDAPGVPKLLVLDLNGALIYRTERNSSGPQRRMYPRPFLSAFLEYLFLDEPDGSRSPWSVLVWSSAQPHNVRAMVEMGFGRFCDGVWNDKLAVDGERRLIDVWARDKMSLGDAYNNNVQTTKDLRKVLTELHKPSEFDERTTVLLDDSSLKGVHQPWSQVIISEFDKPEHLAAKEAVRRMIDRDQPRKSGGKGKEKAKDPSADVSDPSVEPGLDNILLSVIGILEAMRGIANVPAWVRAGGIQNPTGPPIDTTAEVTLDMLPSAADFTHWYNNPKTHAYWAAKGKEALKRKGIKLDHGRTVDGNGTWEGASREVTPVPATRDMSVDPPAQPVKFTPWLEKPIDPAERGTLIAAYGHVFAVANGRLVNDEQRNVLSSALDVLQSLQTQVIQEYRPKETDMRWLRRLTTKEYEIMKKGKHTLELKLLNPPVNMVKRWELSLEILRSRLALVRCQPETPEFDLMMEDYNALPLETPARPRPTPEVTKRKPEGKPPGQPKKKKGKAKK